MTAFVTLQMFKDQNSRKSNQSSARMETQVPFLQWRTGFIVCGKSSRENFTIKEIHSDDGAMKYQDCIVVLVNTAGETRTLRGSTLQSGYDFVSKGDVKDDEPATSAKRDDCVEIDVNVAGIREYYPRKNGDGTRVLMQDKTAYIVADKMHDVRLAIKRAVAEALRAA